MNKIIKAIILSVVVAFPSFADIVPLGSVTVYEAEHETDREVSFSYDTDGFYIMQIKSVISSTWIALTPAQLDTIRASLDKAIEWGKIAEKQKVNIDKDIPNSNMSVNLYWGVSSDTVYSASKVPIRWVFIGADDGEWITVLAPEKAVSNQNEYIYYSPEYIVFLKKYVLAVKDIISEGNVKKTIEKEEKNRKKADELFK